MNVIRKAALAAVTLLAAGQACAQITFYEHDNYQGRAVSADRPVEDFQRIGFNDKTSSIIVVGTPWEVCEAAHFGGRCVVLMPGNYASLRDLNMNDKISSTRAMDPDARPANGNVAPRPVAPQLTFYENDNFQGRSISTLGAVPDLRPYGFNDRASSVVVLGERWEACDNINFGGRCVILRPGRYPSMGAMGLNDRVSSVREVHPATWYEESRYAPAPQAAYDPRRRPGEQFFDVPVKSAHAVYATPQSSQPNCWMEKEQVPAGKGDYNRTGAVVGGVVGGILGHEVAGSKNRELGTIGGALLGAVLGANVGRDQPQATTRDVQRCTTPPPAQSTPQYWDVTYDFKGVEHRVQMTGQPGTTVTVNDRGEPRQ